MGRVNSFGRDRDELLSAHPTVKPVALVADAIKNCSKRGDLILDPFGGSGTTINPRVRQSGLGAAHHGRISKIGRSHARAMLVEAAWAAAKAPGPLHAFFVRIRARRGHQIAAVDR